MSAAAYLRQGLQQLAAWTRGPAERPKEKGPLVSRVLRDGGTDLRATVRIPIAGRSPAGLGARLVPSERETDSHNRSSRECIAQRSSYFLATIEQISKECWRPFQPRTCRSFAQREPRAGGGKVKLKEGWLLSGSTGQSPARAIADKKKPPGKDRHVKGPNRQQTDKAGEKRVQSGKGGSRANSHLWKPAFALPI